MVSEIEIETEKSQKTQNTTQKVITWFMLCSHSMILISKLWKKEGLDSRVCINSKESENIMNFHSNTIIFFGKKGAGPFTFNSRYSDYKSTM